MLVVQDILIGLLLLTTSSSFAVTWEEQAERLQLVSASFLDAAPVQGPNEEGQFLTAKSVLSALPKTNGRVGGKSEQPPQSPVHSVPSIEFYALRFVYEGFGFSGRAWGGYLPKNAAALTGMTASCEESLYGGAAGVWKQFSSVGSLGLEFGLQNVAAKVTGGVTAVDAQDEFKVNTTLQVVTLTFAGPRFLPGLWVQGQTIGRRVDSSFEIPSDGTTLVANDRAPLGTARAAIQASLGYDFLNHVSTSVGYLHVPERVSMPRFMVSYNLPLGPKNQTRLAGGAL